MSLMGYYAAATQWTPEQLGSKVKRWWDTDDLAKLTIGTGNRISAWEDKAVNWTANQGTDANRPSWETNYGGTVRFTKSSSTWLNCWAFPFSGSTPFELWAVAGMSVLPDTGLHTIASVGTDPFDYKHSLTYNSTSLMTPGAAIGMAPNSLFGLNGTATTRARHAALRARFASGSNNAAIAINGTTTTGSPSSFGIAASSPLRLGMDATVAGNRYFDGHIKAFLVTEALTPDEATKMMQWAMSRI